MTASSLVALAACVDVHPFPARTVTAAPKPGGGAEVDVPGLYSMRFSDSAFHFPTSLMIGTTEMLGAGAVDATDELDIGISYYPIQRFDGMYPAAQSLTPMLTIPLKGPSVAKVELDWGAMACASMALPSGQSTFTFFPDGRITRNDHVLLPQSLAASDCGGTGWYITSFATFNLDAVQQVYPTGIPALQTVGTVADNFQYITGAHTIGYGWTDSSTRVRVPDKDAKTIAFVYDFIPQSSPTVANVDRQVTTTMLLDDHESFDQMNARMLPYVHNPDVQLVVNGNPVGLALDGIYGGTQPTMPGGMELADSHVTLQAADTTVPGGFAVWLDFKPLTPGGYTVNRDHSVDLIGSTQAIFWFPGDLAPGDTITITPQ